MADTKTDIKQSDEWQKAVAYEITDKDIERQRKLIGFDQAARTREYIQTATEDNIRNFAHGMGDDKPLYCDPHYARKTRGRCARACSRASMFSYPVPNGISIGPFFLATQFTVSTAPKPARLSSPNLPGAR